MELAEGRGWRLLGRISSTARHSFLNGSESKLVSDGYVDKLAALQHDQDCALTTRTFRKIGGINLADAIERNAWKRPSYKKALYEQIEINYLEKSLTKNCGRESSSKAETDIAGKGTAERGGRSADQNSGTVMETVPHWWTMRVMLESKWFDIIISRNPGSPAVAKMSEARRESARLKRD